MQTRTAQTYLAIIAGAALSLAARPAPAQSLGGSYGQTCQTVNGHLACQRVDRPAAGYGYRAYERWDNGAPAYGSSAPDRYPFRDSVGSYHTWYGFGR